MKRIIRLTESDLTRIVRRVINEDSFFGDKLKDMFSDGDYSRAKREADDLYAEDDECRYVVQTNWSGMEVRTSDEIDDDDDIIYNTCDEDY